MRRIAVLASLLPVLLTAGCATYIEARNNVAPGGLIDQQKAAASRELDTAQAQRAALQQRRAEQEAQLARMDDQLRRLQSEQRVQQQQLSKALQARRISQARHDELRKEIESVKAQTADLQMKVANARLEPAGTAQASGPELQAVQKRHAELSKLVTQLMAN